jgi:hypothetical protein
MKHVQLQELTTSELLLLFKGVRKQLVQRIERELELVRMKLAKVQRKKRV